MATKSIPAILSVSLALSVLIVSFSLSSPSPIKSESPELRSFRATPRFLGKFAELNRTKSTLKSYQYETRYFTQRLDHFGFSDLPTFQQRYLINTDHWLGPERLGPIFLYCGNEGDIEWFAANTGFVWEIAPRFGAMVIFPEHRYYGVSMPYGDRDLAYKNADSLAYLTSTQALADFAVLITDLKRNLSAEACPVVLFGGSYGGMLAAWMRLKYPHIAIGALSSSAPILQFEDIVPPETFYDIVSNDFRRESVSCFNTIKESWDVIQAKGQTAEGLLELTHTFRICKNLNSGQDLSDWLYSAYSYLAMVDYPYPSEFLMPLPGHPIKEVCRKMDSHPDGTSVLERIFAGVNVYYNYTGGVDCFDLEDDPHGMSGWDWQACTEMVMPMSCSKSTSMFPAYDFDYSSYQERCYKEFSVNPRPRWITTEFGGHLINHGVSSSLVEKTKLEIQEFFKLPIEEKKTFWQQPGDLEGYGQAFVVSEEQKLDWADMFYVVAQPKYLRKPHLFQKLPLPFRDTLDDYSLELKNLAMLILEQMGKALKMETGEITELFDDGMQGLRMNYYPPCPQPEQVIGISPHSDGVGITILLQLNEMEGLQIRKDGNWITVKPLPGSFIVNIGDIMEIVSNGTYRSIEHRATVNSEKERLSMAAFYSPNHAKEMGPARSLIGPSRPALFRTIGVADFFKELFSRKLDGKGILEVMKIQNGREMA